MGAESGAAPAPEAAPSVAPASLRTAVLFSPEVMERVVDFLAGGERDAREDLGRASLVCRFWRDVASDEHTWCRVAMEVLPVLDSEVVEVGMEREYLMEQGRCLLAREVWVGDEWRENLCLHFEVWDDRDGLRLLSAYGPLDVMVDQARGLSSLGLKGGGADRRVAIGPPFSVATRDPEGHFVASVKDYFLRAHEAGVPTVLRARVLARDALTGRQALLWESGKRHRFGVFPPSAQWQPLLPNESYNVGSLEPQPVVSGRFRGEPLKGAIGFYVRPDGPQLDKTPRRRMYSIAGADPRLQAQASFFYMYLETANTAEVGSWIRSLLRE
jgi:hypothetical protein